MAYLLKRNIFCCIFKQHVHLSTKVIKLQEYAIQLEHPWDIV